MNRQWESEIAYYRELEKRCFSQFLTTELHGNIKGLASRFSLLVTLLDELYSGNLTGTPNLLNALQKEVSSYSGKIEHFLAAISEHKSVA
jgi:hypothetical protein